jgi:hypothetical protein
MSQRAPRLNPLLLEGSWKSVNCAQTCAELVCAARFAKLLRAITAFVNRLFFGHGLVDRPVRQLGLPIHLSFPIVQRGAFICPVRNRMEYNAP